MSLSLSLAPRLRGIFLLAVLVAGGGSGVEGGASKLKIATCNPTYPPFVMKDYAGSFTGLEVCAADHVLVLLWGFLERLARMERKVKTTSWLDGEEEGEGWGLGWGACAAAHRVLLSNSWRDLCSWMLDVFDTSLAWEPLRDSAYPIDAIEEFVLQSAEAGSGDWWRGGETRGEMAMFRLAGVGFRGRAQSGGENSRRDFSSVPLS